MKRPATYSPIAAALYHQNSAKYLAVAQHAAQQQAMAQAYSNQTATAGGLGSLFTVTSTTGTNTWITALTTSTQALGGVGYPPVAVFDDPHLPPVYKIEDGRPITLRLPDGTIIDVAKDGSFIISDKDAKVTYRANRVRDFNPFINASDKLEAFIKFCGALGVKQDEMLNLPVSLFIKWLIVMAAAADGEEADEEALLALVKQRRPRCTCGRFIGRERIRKKVFFCRSECMERRMAA